MTPHKSIQRVQVDPSCKLTKSCHYHNISPKPNEPKNVHFVQKFVQVLWNQCFILGSKIQNTKSSFDFGKQTISKQLWVVFSHWYCFHSINNTFYIFIHLFIAVFCKRKVLRKNIGIDVKTALVICSLPAWEREVEVLSNPLLHLETKGMNSSILGLIGPVVNQDKWMVDFQPSNKMFGPKTSPAILQINWHKHRSGVINFETSGYGILT